MDAQLKNDHGDLKILEIKASWDEVKDDYEDILRQYSKLRVPGFRTNKAPKEIIQKHYRQQIADDAGAQIAKRLTRKALLEKGLRAVGGVEIIDRIFEFEKSFDFICRFLPLPEFELPNYKNLRLKSIKDEDRRNEISDWLLKNVAFEVPEKLIEEELSYSENPNETEDAEARHNAKQRVRLLMIFEKIAEVEGICLDDSEIEKRLQSMALKTGSKPEILKKEIEKTGGIIRLRRFLIAEKTLTFFVESCSENTFKDGSI